MAGPMSEASLLQANTQFYRALSGLDLAAMEQVWLHEPWVQCLHPGWRMINGWESILESWKRIFESTASMEVEPSQISARVLGEPGWVSCLERIMVPSSATLLVSFAQSTNLFLDTSPGWRMVLHHASALPADAAPAPPAERLH
jgi:hypothetical protein